INEEHVSLILPKATDLVSSAGESFPSSPVLMLVLTARKSLFPTGSLNLSCSCKVHEYQQHLDVTLQLDTLNYTQPHHLPTLQQTGGSFPPPAHLAADSWVISTTCPPCSRQVGHFHHLPTLQQTGTSSGGERRHLPSASTACYSLQLLLLLCIAISTR
ncbi:hypothetical protein FHG87_023949, partial [Trinorchestia longiramus]